MANALTAVRLLLAFPFAFFMGGGEPRHGLYALMALVIAVATDFMDGPLARRAGRATPAGGTFDHTADFLFVTGGLFAGSLRGAFPWIFPVLVTAAFLQYVLDSYWIHRPRGLRGSRLGRYNGALYFVPLFLDALIRLGMPGLPPVLTVLVWGLMVSTLLSMGERLMLTAASRTSAASRGEETTTRLPR